MTQLVVALQANTSGLAQAYPALQQLTAQLNTTQAAVANLAAQTQQGMANIILAVGAAAQAQIAATNNVVAALNQSTTATHQNTVAHVEHNKALIELIKSTQIYLGPLSGVASRFQAFTTLLHEVGPVLAGVGVGFAALAYVTFRAIEEGARFERQFLAIKGALDASNNTMGTTASELNHIAEEVANTTLASLSSARAAAAALATFPNINVNIAKSALLAAQGLSLIGRGDIESQIRRIGKILEDPMNNLNSLRESGIKFSASQQLIIESLQRSGDLFGAQEFVLKRTVAAQGIATAEATGLAGAWDLLKKRSEELFVSLGYGGGVVQTLEAALRDLAGEFEEFSKHEEAVRAIAGFLKSEIRGIATTVRETAKDFEDWSVAFEKVNKWLLDHAYLVGGLMQKEKELAKGAGSLTRALDEEAAGWQKVAEERRKALAEQNKPAVQPGLTPLLAGDIITKAVTTLDPFVTKTRVASEEIEGFNKSVRLLEESGALPELIRNLGLTREMFDQLAQHIREATTPIGAMIDKLDLSNAATKAAAVQAKLLGEAQFQARVHELALNKVIEEKIRFSREEAETYLGTNEGQALAVRLTIDEENKRLALINTLVREQTLRRNLAAETLSMTQQRAPEADIAVAIARAEAQMKALIAGFKEGSAEYDRLIALAEQMARIKTTTDAENRIRLLEQELALQTKEISYFSLVESDRKMVADLEKKRLDLVRQYGPLLNDQARMELGLYQQELKRAQLIKDLGTIYNSVQTGVENVAVATFAALSQGQNAFDALKKSGVQALLAIEAELIKIVLIRPLLQGIGSALGVPTIAASGSATAGVGAVGAGVTATVQHGGGIVGGLGTYRTVDASVFAGAPRLHGGLAPDEFAAVLQRGEEVIPKGGSGGGRTTINIHNYHSDAKIEQRKRSGRSGDIYDVIITNVAKALGNGALDTPMRGFQARQRGAQR